MTRVIGGVAGGRRIAVPPRGTRPTTDRVRESIFNILAARRELAGLAVLDLYAGSGAMGLEALSRGAESALFVEADRRAASVIARNINALGLGGATLRRASVAVALADGAASPVDLVFVDPPYGTDAAEVDAVLAALTDNGWVRGGTIAVVERAAVGAAPAWPAGWSVWPGRVYGDTRVELAEWL